MARIIKSNNRRTDMPVLKPQEPAAPAPVRVLKQAHRREITKISGRYSDLVNEVKRWTELDGDYYLGFGGTGDALLVLSACWNNPRARVVFFANPPSMRLIQELFSLFKIGIYLHNNIMGQSVAGHIFNHLTRMPNFRTSGHLADGLNYGDWVNEPKYRGRIVNNVPWKHVLGTAPLKRTAIIAPVGSHKDHRRQRYISPAEHKKLVAKCILDGLTPYTIGSDEDYHQYGDSGNFASSAKLHEGGQIKPINLHQMLQIIHSAEIVYSTDTWLKTYTALNRIPTKVIKTRWAGQYRSYGVDVTDFIFLNQAIWPTLELVEIERLIAP